jgi:hypothetical protein
MKTQAGSRLLLLTPPTLLVISSIVMLVASPFAWGAATYVHIPAWMPTGAGVAFGAAGLVIGGWTLLGVLRRTRREFHAFGFQLIVGAFLMVIATLLELGLASRITDSSTYSNFVDENGKILVTTTAFVVYTLFGIFVMSALTTMFGWMYVQAITDAHVSGAALRRPGERDAIGEILRSR